MDRPSSSRVRPTASNRKRRQLAVEEPDVSEEEVEEQQEEMEEQPQEEQPAPGPEDRSLLTSFGTHIAGFIWTQQDRGPLKCLSHGQKVSLWQLNESDRFRDLVLRSRLAPLATASYRSVNKIVVSGFVERWQPENNTFHMPFGEMTITLDDVASILGIPVIGRTVSYNERMSYEEAQALLVDALGVELVEAHEELMQVRGQSVRLEWLRERFAGVSDDDGDDMIDCAVRAYILYLLGCTLFTDKSGTRVPIIFLTHLVDVEAIRSYAWGTAALAYLYRQLGLATRHEVKQIADYLTLLEAWVYEHFECLAPTPNLLYIFDQLRVHRWIPRRESAPLQGIRERLDSMSTDQVTWDPYRDVRQYHPFNEVAYYCGCIKCMDVVEPYHPDRVLRQFRRVQTIPPPPLAPIRATRGPTARDYQIAYQYINQVWEGWPNHILSTLNRSHLVRHPADCVPGYMNWYVRVSWRILQNPNFHSNFAPRPEENVPSGSGMIDYRQRNTDALSILDELTERGEDHWVEDPRGLYAHVNQVAYVLRGVSIDDARRTFRHPHMSSQSYSRTRTRRRREGTVEEI